MPVGIKYKDADIEEAEVTVGLKPTSRGNWTLTTYDDELVI